VGPAREKSGGLYRGAQGEGEGRRKRETRRLSGNRKIERESSKKRKNRQVLLRSVKGKRRTTGSKVRRKKKNMRKKGKYHGPKIQNKEKMIHQTEKFH